MRPNTERWESWSSSERFLFELDPKDIFFYKRSNGSYRITFANYWREGLAGHDYNSDQLSNYLVNLFVVNQD